MSRLARAVPLLALLTGAPAFAQFVCAMDPPPKCLGGACKTVCSVKGDPVNMMSGETMHVVRDLAFNSSNGPFELWRYYSSSPWTSRKAQLYGNDWPAAAKPPFGTQSSGDGNPKWSHGLFSFVVARAS